MYVHHRSSFYRLGIVVFVVILAILAITTLTTAQTSEPTPEPTLDAIDDTPADTPADPTEVVDIDVYQAAVDRLTAIIVFLLGIGGVSAIVAILKLNPATAKVAVNTGIDLLELAARFTKSPHDEAALERIRAEFNARIDQILLNMTPPATAQSVQPVILQQTLPGVPVAVAGTQLSVNEQVANIEAQLSLLRDYMGDTSAKDVVGGPSEEPDFPHS